MWSTYLNYNHLVPTTLVSNIIYFERNTIFIIQLVCQSGDAPKQRKTEKNPSKQANKLHTWNGGQESEEEMIIKGWECRVRSLDRGIVSLVSMFTKSIFGRTLPCGNGGGLGTPTCLFTTQSNSVITLKIKNKNKNQKNSMIKWNYKFS